MKKHELEELISAHQNELHRYVQFLGADPVWSEEVVQDTFVTAYFHKNLPDLSNVNKRISWLRAVAKNIFLQQCRIKKKDSSLISNADNLDHFWIENVTEDYLFQKKEALSECLRNLPEKQIKAVNMRYVEKLTRNKMADILNMKENGVKALLRRIRHSLSQCIKLKLEPNS